MYEYLDKVYVKSKNVSGIIVDITETKPTMYIVESDIYDAKNDEWPLYDCYADDLKFIAHDE